MQNITADHTITYTWSKHFGWNKGIQIPRAKQKNKTGLFLLPPEGGGGVLPYMGYIGMYRCEGYGFQVVYSRIGCINQSVWV